MSATHIQPDRIFGQVKSPFMIQCAILIFFFILSGHSSVYGVVGCNCNDPDRDVARLFPESTGYKVIYASLKKKGGEKLLDAVEARLGDRSNSEYCGLDESSTIYEVLSGKKKIGYLHGVNQKGQVGNFQVFLALDPLGTITGFFTRKMTNGSVAQLRDPGFEQQFVGLTMKDFELFDAVSGKSSGKVDGLKNPVPESREDFTAILRAVKKNLILMDEFIFSEQHTRASQETQLK
jgi:hypothetical protein